MTTKYIAAEPNSQSSALAPAVFSGLSVPHCVVARRKIQQADYPVLVDLAALGEDSDGTFGEPSGGPTASGEDADNIPPNPSDAGPVAHVQSIDLTRPKLLQLSDGLHAPAILADQVLERMVLNNAGASRLFKLGDAPARIIVDEAGAARTQVFTRDILSNEIGQVASFTDYRQKRHIGVPNSVLAHLMGRPSWPFQTLSRIVSAPVFTANGSLVSTPGYDSASGLYLQAVPGFVVAPIPDRPTDAHIRAALNQLLEVVWDFPFANEASFHNYFALLIEPFVREIIRGPTPLHLFKKPVQGTGATLLADIFSEIAFGLPAATQAESRDEEIRKNLTAFILSGGPLYFLDNLNNKLDSSALALALTTGLYHDRVLGGSVTMKAPVRHVWLASGNNPELSDEIGRRTSFIELDARVEDPTKRGLWRHPNIIGYARRHRPEIVRALLILIRAWFAAGRPPGPRVLASFESWSRTIGGILHNVGADEFLANHDRLKGSARNGDTGIKSFVELWWHQHGSNGCIHIGRVDKDQFGQLKPVPGTLCEILYAHRSDLDFGFLSRPPNTWWSALGRTLHKAAGRTFEISDSSGARLQVVVSTTRSAAGQEYALARV